MFWLKWGFRAVLALVLFAFFHYSLPQRDIVQVVGTEVVRMDVSGGFWASKDAGTNADTSTRDVRFINTIYDTGDTMEFRNEDTAWSWPPYLKFDSGKLQAQAQFFSGQGAEKWVAVTHYGWRFEYFSLYPNAVKIKEVAGPDVRLIPWFNIIFLTILALAVIATLVRINRWKNRNIDPVLEDIGEAYDDVTDSVAAQRGRIGRWLDTWKSKKG